MEACPEIKANVFSRLTTGWINRLLSKGYKEPLEPADLYVLDERFQTAHVGERLEGQWGERRQAGGKWPLFHALSSAFAGPFYWSGLLKLLGDAAAMASPFVLRLLIENMTRSIKEAHADSSTTTQGYLLCLAIFGLQVFNTITVNFYFSNNFRVGMRARTALNALIYKKSQRLSAAARQEFSTGQMVNLVSTDSSRIENSALYLHYIWSGPFQIAVILGVLYSMIGISAFVGLAMFVVFVPIQSKVTSWLSQYRKVSGAYVSVAHGACV